MELIIENGVLVKCNSNENDDTVVVIPENVSAIANNAFWMNKTIEEVIIPAGVLKIGAEAFRWCENLKKVTFSEGLLEISELAFYGCKKIKTIQLPKSLKRINRMAFGYTGIKNILVPETIEYIAGDAFYMLIHPLYTNETWEIFSAKTDRGFNINDCVCLKKGVLEKYTPNDMFNEEEEIYIPHGVKGIGNTAFDKAIIKQNFYRWKAKKIFLPESINQIGKLTFNKCKDIIICARVGSYAEKYAKDRGLIFEAVDY